MVVPVSGMQVEVCGSHMCLSGQSFVVERFDRGSILDCGVHVIGSKQ